jgi:hypothetical protein
MLRFLVLLFTYLSLILSFSLSRAEVKESHFNLYTQDFENIQDFGSFKASSLKGKSSVWIVFQPECQSCKLQFKALDCLPLEVSKVAVGINGRKEQLQSAIKLMNFNGFKVCANLEFEKAMKIDGTPTILWIDGHGKIQKKSTGLQSCLNLNSFFKK